MTRRAHRVLAWKELRALAPMWCAAAAATALGAATMRGMAELAYAYGVFALGAQAIGYEYTYRTLGTMLVQPADRRRIYAIKLVVLAIALVGLAVVGWTVLPAARDESLQIIVLAPLGAVTFGPLMTMLCRHQLAGTLFTAVPSGMVLAAAHWLSFQIHAEEALADALAERIWFSTMCVMAPAAAIMGWRRFTRLEAIEGTGQPMHLPRVFSARARRNGARGKGGHDVRARRLMPICQQAVKELHLQQMALVTAGLYVVGTLWGFMQLERQSVAGVIGVLTPIYAAAVALLIGSLSSAEERQLGTWAAELMQPVPAWRRWTVKVVVAMTLAIAIGAALPGALLRFAPVSIPTPVLSGPFVALIVAVTALGMYVSSLSQSGVRALAWGGPAALAAAVFAQRVQTVAHAYTGPLLTRPETGPVVAVLGVAILVLMLVWLAFLNHHTLERRPSHLAGQIAALLTVIATGALLA